MAEQDLGIVTRNGSEMTPIRLTVAIRVAGAGSGLRITAPAATPAPKRIAAGREGGRSDPVAGGEG